MARYSSDSDSDRSNKYRRKHYGRSRSSSSESSDSSSYRKRSSKSSKSKRRHRSRSKSRETQRSSKNYKSSRRTSKDRDRRKDSRYKSRKSRSNSPDRSKKKGRSVSREKSTSRSSSSQSFIKSTTDKSYNLLGKADDFSIEPRIKESVLDEINSEGFAPQQFTSSAKSKEKKSNKNIVIDISSDTIRIPPAPTKSIIEESIFHASILMDQDVRFDKWVRKLYNLRQKAMADLSSNVT